MAQCFGIGKASAIKQLNASRSLLSLGKTDSLMEDIVKEATAFMVACYGIGR